MRGRGWGRGWRWRGSRRGGGFGSSGSENADEVNFFGCLCLNVVGLVVGVIAWEYVAAGDGRRCYLGPHLLDVGMVVGINNGGDVEIGYAHPALEGDFAKHTRHIWTALGDGVPVANPALGEVDGDGLKARDNGIRERGVTDAGSEDHGALDWVLANKLDGVGQRGPNCRE